MFFEISMISMNVLLIVIITVLGYIVKMQNTMVLMLVILRKVGNIAV